jgi:hypothetical protein
MQKCNVAYRYNAVTAMLTAFFHIQLHVGQFYLTLGSLPSILRLQACIAVVIKVKSVRSITVTLLLPYHRAITVSSDNDPC